MRSRSSSGQSDERIAECRDCTRANKWICDLHARLPPDYDEAADYGIKFLSPADGDWIITKEGTDMAKNHSITVTITSTSGGDTNQVVSFTEFAGSPEELVAKNFAIAGAVVAAVQGACAELAAPYAAKAPGKK